MKLENIFYILISTGLTAFLNFIIQIYVARNSTAEMFGVFSIYNTIILIAFNIINLGLGHFFIRKYSQDNNCRKIDINSIFIFTVSCFLGLMLLSGFLYNFFEPIGLFNSFLISTGVIGYCVHELIQSYYVGIQEKHKIFLWQPILHLSRLVFLFFIFYSFGSMNFYNLGLFCISYSSFIILVVYINRNSIFDLYIENLCLKKVNYILKSSIWFAIVGFLYVLYSQFSILYIGKKISTELAGYFNIGYTFIMLSLLIPNTIYYKVLLPKMHGWFINDKYQLKRSYRWGAFLSLVLGTLNLGILYFLGEWLIVSLYGQDYLGSVEYFKWIILSIPFFYLSIHLGVYSYIGDSQKYKALILLLVTVFSITINFILIELYDILGAAFGLIFVAIFMSILYHLLNKFILFNKFFREVD